MTARFQLDEPIRRFTTALGWIAVFGVTGYVAMKLLGLVIPMPARSPWRGVADYGAQALGFGLTTWGIGRLAAKRSWAELGWGPYHVREFLGEILRRAGLGAALAVLAVVLAIASGARLGLTPDWVRYDDILVPVALGLFLAALSEELLFRGFPLRALADAVGAWPATLLLAFVFGLAHVGQGGGFVGLVNITLAAVWLSVAFFSPGRMPAAVGLHFGWNAGLALLFDAPVSGLTFNVPVVDYAPGQLGFLDGGTFGPEGGLVGTVAFVAGVWVLAGGQWRRVQRWLEGSGGLVRPPAARPLRPSGGLPSRPVGKPKTPPRGPGGRGPGPTGARRPR